MAYYKKLNINGTEYPIAVNITGQGAPSELTEAEVGMLYMDTDTGEMYKRTLNGWAEFSGGGSDSLDLAVAEEDVKCDFFYDGTYRYDAVPHGSGKTEIELSEGDSAEINFPTGNYWSFYISNTSDTHDTTVEVNGGVCSIPGENYSPTFFGLDEYLNGSVVISVSKGSASIVGVRHIEGKNGLMSSEDKATLKDIENNMPKKTDGSYMPVASREVATATKVANVALVESTSANGETIYTLTESEYAEGVPILSGEYIKIMCSPNMVCSFTLNISFLPTGFVTINGVNYYEADTDITFENVTEPVVIVNPQNVPIEMSNLSVSTVKDGLMSGADKAALETIKTEIGDINAALDELHAYAQVLIGGEE